MAKKKSQRPKRIDKATFDTFRHLGASAKSIIKKLDAKSNKSKKKRNG